MDILVAPEKSHLEDKPFLLKRLGLFSGRSTVKLQFGVRVFRASYIQNSIQPRSNSKLKELPS